MRDLVVDGQCVFTDEVGLKGGAPAPMGRSDQLFIGTRRAGADAQFADQRAAVREKASPPDTAARNIDEAF